MALTFNFNTVEPRCVQQWDCFQQNPGPLTLNFRNPINLGESQSWLYGSPNSTIITMPGYVYTAPSEPIPAPPARPKTQRTARPRTQRRVRPQKTQVRQPLTPNKEGYIPFQGVRNPNARYEIVRCADGKLYETEVVNSGHREKPVRFSERPPAKTFWGRVGQGFMKVFDGISDFVSAPVTTVRNWICGKPEAGKQPSPYTAVADFAAVAATCICAPPVGLAIGVVEGLNKFVNWLLD